MKAEIIVERNNKIFQAGERIRGQVHVTNAPIGVSFASLLISFEGIIKSQGNPKHPGV